MSRRRTDRHLEEPDVSRERAIKLVLDEVCVTLGYCIPPEAQSELCANPPATATELAVEIYRAEGLERTDSDVDKQMVQIIERGVGHLL